jgi:hypothetical protein
MNLQLKIWFRLCLQTLDTARRNQFLSGYKVYAADFALQHEFSEIVIHNTTKKI